MFDFTGALDEVFEMLLEFEKIFEKTPFDHAAASEIVDGIRQRMHCPMLVIETGEASKTLEERAWLVIAKFTELRAREIGLKKHSSDIISGTEHDI